MSTKYLIAIGAFALAGSGFYWVTGRGQRHEDETEEAERAQPTAAGIAGARITDDSARVLALAQVPGGTIADGGIETEDGKVIYSFDIAVPGKSGIEEIHIDAATGAVLLTEHETDESEAAEKAKEVRKAKGGP